jgi:hypothetical protein
VIIPQLPFQCLTAAIYRPEISILYCCVLPLWPIFELLQSPNGSRLLGNFSCPSTSTNFRMSLLRPFWFSTQLRRRAQWHSWWTHCATSLKVTDLIPDGVIAIFHRHNPSGRTMALGSTQLVTEMRTRNISWRVNAAGEKGANLATFTCRLSGNPESLSLNYR